MLEDLSFVCVPRTKKFINSKSLVGHNCSGKIVRGQLLNTVIKYVLLKQFIVLLQ